MRYIVLSFALIINFSNVFGQDFLGQYKEDIKKYFSNCCDSTFKISFTEEIVKVEQVYYGKATIARPDTTSILKVSIDGFVNIDIECFFNEYTNSCDSMVLKFDCCQCLDKYLSDILTNKGRKWKKLDNNRYISRKWSDKQGEKIGSPQILVAKTMSQPNRGTIYLSIPMIEKEQWKKLIKD